MPHLIRCYYFVFVKLRGVQKHITPWLLGFLPSVKIDVFF